MFHSARLKLTAWYLLIIMTISLSFSAVIFHTQKLEIDRFVRTQRFQLELRFPNVDFPLRPTINYELIDDIKRRLFLTLGVINLSILAISGITSYFLAGVALDPIQKMLSEQRRFVSDSSHELRTPLTALKSSLEVNLRDPHLTLADAKTLLQDSLADVNRLQQLSDNLLSLAQYDNPKSQPFTKISTNEIIIKATNQLSPLAALKNIKLKLVGENYFIHGLEDKLSELLVILIDNAIKYSPNGKTVTIKTLLKDRHVIIEIKDQGIGIGEKDIPHIFDRFYRADTARSNTTISGYGLGLSIAKKIVDVHHATIKVTSQLGKGTTFQLIFGLFN